MKEYRVNATNAPNRFLLVAANTPLEAELLASLDGYATFGVTTEVTRVLQAGDESDKTPVDFEWLAGQCERVDSTTAEEDGNVYWECGEISFTCDSRQDDPGEPWVACAVDWRVGWETLPRALVPETRGEFRMLCKLANKVNTTNGG